MHFNGIDAPTTTPHSPAKAYSDAAVRDGFAAAGYALFTHGSQLLWSGGTAIGTGHGGSMQAEHEAVRKLVRGLDGYDELQHLTVKTDCEPVAEQFSAEECDVSNYETVTVEWIPRSQNHLADSIADRWVEKTTDFEEQERPFGICD